MQGKAAVVAVVACALGLGGCAAGTSHPASAKPKAKMSANHTAAHSAVLPVQAATAPPPAHVYYQNQVVILMYHGLALRAHGDYITPTDFAGELAALKSNGFTFVTLAQIQAFLHGGTLPPNAVTLTFDDGLESVYTYAYPILLRDNIPFATFLIAGRVNNLVGDLTWVQIRAMIGSGLLTVGSHTFNSHGSVASGPHSTSAALVTRIYNPSTGQTESQAHYVARIEGDLVRARKILQVETGQSVTWFAYPFGAYDPQVQVLLTQAGYTDAVTTWGWGTTAYAHPLALPRENAGTPIYNGPSLVNMVLYVAGRTAKNPKYPTPVEVVPNWP